MRYNHTFGIGIYVLGVRITLNVVFMMAFFEIKMGKQTMQIILDIQVILKGYARFILKFQMGFNYILSL